jgi:Rod binding domain-containing protein
MTITSDITMLSRPSTAAVVSAAGGDGKDFSQLMTRRMKQLAARGADQKEQASKAAQQFVSTALVMPMLKQMRSSTFKSEYFHGGHGEDAFGPQLDQILADRIVQRMSTPQQDSTDGPARQGLGLVDAVYRRILRQTDQADTNASAFKRKKVDTHG